MLIWVEVNRREKARMLCRPRGINVPTAQWVPASSFQTLSDQCLTFSLNPPKTSLSPTYLLGSAALLNCFRVFFPSGGIWKGKLWIAPKVHKVPQSSATCPLHRCISSCGDTRICLPFFLYLGSNTGKINPLLFLFADLKHWKGIFQDKK